MGKIFRNLYIQLVLCFLMGAIFVFISGRVSIPYNYPDFPRRTNLTTFHNLLQNEYTTVYKGWPIKYNETLSTSDPTDSCAICNRSHTTPCFCGMPAQIYHTDINWGIAIVNLIIVGTALFLIFRIFFRRKQIN